MAINLNIGFETRSLSLAEYRSSRFGWRIQHWWNPDIERITLFHSSLVKWRWYDDWVTPNELHFEFVTLDDKRACFNAPSKRREVERVAKNILIQLGWVPNFFRDINAEKRKIHKDKLAKYAADGVAVLDIDRTFKEDVFWYPIVQMGQIVELDDAMDNPENDDP